MGSTTQPAAPEISWTPDPMVGGPTDRSLPQKVVQSPMARRPVPWLAMVLIADEPMAGPMIICGCPQCCSIVTLVTFCHFPVVPFGFPRGCAPVVHGSVLILSVRFTSICTCGPRPAGESPVVCGNSQCPPRARRRQGGPGHFTHLADSRTCAVLCLAPLRRHWRRSRPCMSSWEPRGGRETILVVGIYSGVARERNRKHGGSVESP